MLSRLILPFFGVLLALLPGGAAIAAESPRIADVRVGKHADFDRLVIEFERPPEVRSLREEGENRIVLEVEAHPLLPHQKLDTSFKRMQSVRIEPTADGARVELQAQPHRTRAYRLADPPRIVIDLADAGPEPFLASAEADALEIPFPAAPPVKEVEAPSAPVAQDPPRSDAPNSAQTSEPVEVPQTSPEPAPTASTPAEGATLPEELPQGSPEPRVEPVRAVGGPSDAYAQLDKPREFAAPPGDSRAKSFLNVGLATVLCLLLFGALGFAALAWVRIRASKRRQAAAQARATALAQPVAPETITSDEVFHSADRIEILEKRIDEEVRARLNLEEHVKQLQEEIKVSSDRLHRLSRRSEGTG